MLERYLLLISLVTAIVNYDIQFTNTFDNLHQKVTIRLIAYKDILHAGKSLIVIESVNGRMRQELSKGRKRATFIDSDLKHNH
jgi:hypothetical protein